MQNYTVVAAWNERPLGSHAAVAALARYEEAGRSAGRARRGAEAAAAAVAGFAAAARAHVQRKQVASLEKARPPVDEAMAVEDRRARTYASISAATTSRSAPRRRAGFPHVLAGDKPLSLGADRSGRREFAEWLTRPDHPLTARVMVNRVWAGHFGAGLVRSPDNFGRLGERPTHPELLDWLASEFVENGWSHQAPAPADPQLGHVPDELATTTQLPVSEDPENRLLSHFNRRRLDAEEIRDGMLAVGGPARPHHGRVAPEGQPAAVRHQHRESQLRGLRLPASLACTCPVIRSAVYDVLQTLDFPDPSVPTVSAPRQRSRRRRSSCSTARCRDQTAEALAKSMLAKRATTTRPGCARRTGGRSAAHADCR